MRFVRNMPWLRFVFPSSEMPREGPSVISDDVQYTADYFGGGYAIREPQAWYSRKVATKAASDTLVQIDLMPEGETVRILGCGVSRGVAGPQVNALYGALCTVDPAGTTVVPLGDPLTPNLIPAGASINYYGYVPMRATNVPGTSRLSFYFYLGDNIDYLFHFFFISVPRGVAIGP